VRRWYCRKDIRGAYKERIAKLTWMSDSTKNKSISKTGSAFLKLDADKWKDFGTLQIEEGPWISNVHRTNAWWHNYRNKIN
jgi:putative endopeptidase